MKATPVSRYLYDNTKLEDTEFALAISPCPQIAEAREFRDSAHPASKRSGSSHGRQPRESRRTRFDDNELVESLTMGWAIALAIAVALVVYTSGG